MPCRNPCRLYIYLAFTYIVGPSSLVCSELGLAPPLPPMRVVEVQWSWTLSLVCEVALSLLVVFCGINHQGKNHYHSIQDCLFMGSIHVA